MFSPRLRQIIIVFAALVALVAGYFLLILDWQGRPFCHKQIHLAFKVWMDESGLDMDSCTNAFPNVGGVSRDSLELIRNEMGGYMDWARNYCYVSGLRENDPGHLILMYVNQPTRWIWHGEPRSIFRERKWIVVPVDFTEVVPAGGTLTLRGVPYGGELSECLDTDEFKRRLKETIEFVRTNERPNWQTIVAEQTKVLESIKP